MVETETTTTGEECFVGRGSSLEPQTLGPYPSSWSGGYKEALCHKHFSPPPCVSLGELQAMDDDAAGANL